MFGDVNGVDYCDAVYRDPDTLRDVLLSLSEKVGGIICKHVQVESPLYVRLKDVAKVIRIDKNVKIVFGDDFNEYIKSLSKSVRQNLRTSVNRLKRDGHTLQLKAFYGGDKQIAHEMKRCLRIYEKRHFERYGVKTPKWKAWLLYHQHFATRNYLLLPTALTLVLYIDGEVAGFMSGLLGNAGQFVVPRLSINSDFLFYSPGMLLVQEAVRYFVENTHVRCLDLAKGEELYKYKMGGMAHDTVDFML